MIKQTKLAAIISFFLIVSSCGTIFKNRPDDVKVSDQIDYQVLAYNMMGLPFFLFPGLLAIGIDYYTGALFLTREEAYAEDNEINQSHYNETVFPGK